MSAPQIKNDAETWRLMWDSAGLLFTFERVEFEKRDVYALLSVDSTRPDRKGHMLGPQRINLVSSSGQTSTARQLTQRVGKETGELCHDLLVQSCAIVLQQFKQPTPSFQLSERQEDLGPVEYLVPGLLPSNETTFIYGDSESCKSMLALTIGMCAQAGIPLPWGGPPIPQTNVLVLDWETNSRTMSWRLHRLAAGLPEPIKPPPIAYKGVLWKRDIKPLGTLDDELPNLRKDIVRENIGLVIVDSIGFAIRGKLVDDDVARQAISNLRHLGPATRLVVAHISKESAGMSSGRVDPFGSAFFRAGLRSGFEIRRTEDVRADGIVGLGVYHHKSNEGQHVSPFALELEFGGDNGPIEVRKGNLWNSPDLAERLGTRARLEQFLKVEGGRSIREIAEGTGIPSKTIDTTLRRHQNVTFQLLERRAGQASIWGLRA